MANEQNLIPINKRPKSEQRAIQKKGTEASRRKRQEAKTYKEIAKAIMPLIVTDDDITAHAKRLGLSGDIDLKTLSFMGIVQAAMAGDVKAFEKLIELLGEKEADTNDGQITALLKGLKHE